MRTSLRLVFYAPRQPAMLYRAAEFTANDPLILSGMNALYNFPAVHRHPHGGSTLIPIHDITWHAKFWRREPVLRSRR